MKQEMVFKSVLTAAAAVVLAACGGGGGGAAAPEVAWASPAVFVTPGASSKAYALAGCTLDSYDSQTRETEFDGPLYQASLNISSNGDLSIVAAKTDGGARAEVWSQPFAQAGEVGWAVAGSSSQSEYMLRTYYEEQSAETVANRYMEKYLVADTHGEGNGQLYARDEDSKGLDSTIRCNMADLLALQVNIDGARAAKNLGAGAGVTTYDDSHADGRIESGFAYWYGRNGAAQYDHKRFNLATGELASSASASGPYTPISVSLPVTPSYGTYSEGLVRNAYESEDLKSVCLYSYSTPTDASGQERPKISSSTGYYIEASAYGNKFLPRGGRLNPSRFESPQEFSTGCTGVV